MREEILFITGNNNKAEEVYNGLENLDRYIRWNFGGKMNL